MPFGKSAGSTATSPVRPYLGRDRASLPRARSAQAHDDPHKVIGDFDIRPERRPERGRFALEAASAPIIASSGPDKKRCGHQPKRRATARDQKSLTILGSTSRASRKAASSACHIARGSLRCVSFVESNLNTPSPQMAMISAGLVSTPPRAGTRRHACSRSSRNPDQVCVNQYAISGTRASTSPGMIRNGAPGRCISSLALVSSKQLRFKSACATILMSIDRRPKC